MIFRIYSRPCQISFQGVDKFAPFSRWLCECVLKNLLQEDGFEEQMDGGKKRPFSPLILFPLLVLATEDGIGKTLLTGRLVGC